MKLIRLGVSQARQEFTGILKEMEAHTSEETVVLVCRRARPVAAIISVAEVVEYLRWKRDRIRIQKEATRGVCLSPQDRDAPLAETSPLVDTARIQKTAPALSTELGVPEGSLPPEECARYYPPLVDTARIQKTAPALSTKLRLPDGRLPPEESARHYLSNGLPPEKVTRGLMKTYGPHGLTEDEAERIVADMVQARRTK